MKTTELPFGSWQAQEQQSTAVVGGKQIAFVFDDVADYQSIVASIGDTASVYVLDAKQNGLEQIAAQLGQEAAVSAVHIFSHGSAGQIRLGSLTLDAQNIQEYGTSLQRIGESLAGNRDLLFYGCQVGAGDEAPALLSQLATLTGADVAASSDLTGSAALGGNWVLERSEGAIQTPSIHADSYAGVLGYATPTASYSVEALGTTRWVVDAVGLPSDKSAVLLRDPATYKLWLRFYDSAGTKIGSDVDVFSLTDNESTTLSSNQVKILGLANGRVLIEYNKNDSGAPGSNNAFFIEVDQTGAEVVTDQQINTVTGSVLTRNADITELSNGDIAFSWQRPDNGSFATRVFKADGTAVSGENLLASVNGSVSAIAASSNGTYMVVYGYNVTASGHYTNYIDYKVYSNAGALQSSGNFFTGAVDSNAPQYELIPLTSGNYYYTENQYSTGTIGKVISPSGSVVSTTGVLPANAFSGNIIPIRTTGSEGFVVAEAVSTPAFNWGVDLSGSGTVAEKFYYFNNSGTLVSTTPNVASGSYYYNNYVSYSYQQSFSPSFYVHSGYTRGVGVLTVDYPNAISSGGTDGARSIGARIFDQALADTTPPTVGTVSVPANGTYKAGDNLDFTVNFSEAVNVVITGGVPYLPLTLDTGGTVNASYVSGSGTSALVFRYTVASGNLDSNGVAVGSAITANGGTLKDAATNSATLTLNGVASTAAVLVDGVAPTVSSVAVPTGATYIAGDTLSFTVNFSENITVNTVGGTPRLALDIGGVTKYATYQSGSGSSALVFSYAVENGLVDSDGIAVSSLSANGGSLKDTAGNSVVTTLNSVGATASILVDSTVPTVASVAVPANGTYLAGGNLDFTVNFGEAVTVDTTGGTPRLALDIGGTTKYATYMSGSGSTALVFRYAVDSGLTDSDGITLGLLSTNGGSLRDGVGNNATLTLNSVGSTLGVKVDSTPPTVSNVSASTANGAYKAGDVVAVTVQFSEAVDVSGTPQLTLETGTTDRVANYAGGSGTNTLTFNYTVQAGDTASDLDYVGTGALALNGGTVKDAVGNDAVLALAAPGAAGSLGANKGIVIDTAAPAVSSVAVPANGAYKVGQNLDFTVNFGENITVVGTDSTLGLTIGSAAQNATYLSKTANSITYRYTVQTGDADSDGIALGSLNLGTSTFKDAAGNSAGLSLNNPGATTAVLVDGVAPTVASVAVPGSGTYLSGQALSFTVNFSEAVAVDTTGGTPRLALDIGGATKYATYQSGSGTSALVFSYAAESGLTDNDGIAIGALQANGGSVKDGAGNDATLTLNSVASTAGVLVDSVVPTVSSVAVPANGTYKAGDSLSFTVNFSEIVAVDTSGGTPRLALDIGGVTKYAPYQSGTGTTGLTFSYTMESGLTDSDGITVNSLGVNGGTLRDASGNNANLALNSVGSTAAINADSAPPTVTAVSATTANGTYKAGDTIALTVKFGEAVTVTGAPQLTLETGTTDQVAIYVGGSGSDTLNFTYTVQAGDSSTDLDYAATTALALNSGTIKDAVGNDATLTLAAPGAAGSLGANKAIVIDTLPGITSASYDAATGVLAVTARNLEAKAGVANDIDVTKLSIQGEGGSSYTLTSANVEIASPTAFGITLNAADKAALNQILNKDGGIATGGSTYNLAAAEDWDAGAAAAFVIADPTGNGITVSNVAAPTISSVTYDKGSGVLTVSGTGFLKLVGANNDIDVSKLSLTGEGGVPYTLTSSSVDIASGSSFSITLNAADNAAMALRFTKDGLSASDSTVYNLTAAEDWAAGAAAAVVVADGTNPVTVSSPSVGPPPVTKDDGDNIPPAVEQQVPSLPPVGGGNAVPGDGNGDGVADSQQANVTSVPFLHTTTAQTNPGDSPPVYVTLVADSTDGKASTTQTATAVLKELAQLDAPANLPANMELPLGLISFKADVQSPGTSESFSLYVDGNVLVNGYWKEMASGSWVNLASPEYGGKVVTEGGKTRLDFSIVDGGIFDSDGQANGTISDPGGPGYLASAATNADADKDHFPDSLEAANGLQVGVKDNNVFASTKLYLMELYRDILFREGETGGLAYWQGRMDSGELSRPQVASLFLDSSEFQTGAGGIARLYLGALGRLPDNAGMDSWMASFLAGNKLASLATGFLASTEFQSKYGSLDNAGFVSQLYQNVLGRTGASGEISGWVDNLAAGTSRVDVLLSFTESAEYRAMTDAKVTVALDYVGLLGRTPEQGGFDYWVGQLANGVAEVAVIGNFMATQEYHDRFLP